jgi:aryl-alcohol dehydrogenase-like predicted oxidoreductase
VTRIGTTDLDVFPLCLGGNVFGWTADEQRSFSVLDAYAAAGGNFVDTADIYSGGDSETIIGNWLAARGNRDEMVIATKVGGAGGLGAQNIQRIAEDSLRRLQTDRIDLYYAHFDDASTSLEETLGAFDALVREGKVRHVAASNYTAPRLAEALAVSERLGLTRYVALQPHYNLVEREEYEGELAELCAREGLACLPYFALAKGFLTGKYRPGTDVESPRASRASVYLDEGGLEVLAALDEIAAAHQTTVAAVSLSWLLAQPTVAAPIASARTPAQLADWLPAAELRLSDEELQRLSSARAQGQDRTVEQR